jgi:hypothetical protein
MGFAASLDGGLEGQILLNAPQRMQFSVIRPQKR